MGNQDAIIGAIGARRALLRGTAAVALAMPLRARAQAPMRRLGVLMSLAEGDPNVAPRLAAFRRALQELGWREGETLRTELRWGDGRGPVIQEQAAALVALAPEVILANGTPVVSALQPLTRSIPIVCAMVIDPVGLGFVETLARPGGNITGFTFVNPGLIAKWLGLLKDVAPGLRRAALLYNPGLNPWYPRFLQELANGPQRLPLDVEPVVIDSGDALRERVPELARTPGTGLIIGPESFVLGRFGELAGLAQAHRLPGVSVYPQFAQGGGLMAYGPNGADIFRRAAGYVDRILRGASPAALPVQEPVKFELTLNHRTANALGLTLSPHLLAAADEVLED